MSNQAPPPPRLAAGTLMGPYRLVRILGSGGMGEVYEAVHEALGRPVALKVLHGEGGSPERFIREGRAAASVRHPHVVEVTDVGIQDGVRYLVMELLVGEALSELLARRRQLSLTAALELTLPLVDALAYSHECGVIHRDIKPSNVMLTRGSAGRPLPKLVDFGLSKITASGGQTATDRITHSRIVLGSPQYMSPEQCRSTRDVSEATDQYSLGVLLYELLAGTSPFEGATVWQILAAVQEGRTRPIGKIIEGLPDAFVESLERSMAFDSGARFPSMRAFGADLLQWASPQDQVLWSPVFSAGPLAFADTMAWPQAAADPHASTQEVPPPRTTLPPSNLPRRSSTFVGRDYGLSAVAAALAGRSNLVTIRGPGGVGKTRLAQEFAARNQQDFPGGVWFCELEGTRSREDLLREVAITLTVPLFDEGDAGAQLGRALDSRGPVLVILDNLEQVLEDAHAVVSQWLQAAPEARFLATSREALRIEGETVVTLDSLDLAHAVQLFEDRAGAVFKGFTISPANRDTVEAIVERLDCLCLAIELAAARCSVLSPESLLEQLGQRFRVLKSNRRDLSSRQATIWGAIEWSWNLLEAWEAAALAQCSVFRGGFTLEAAEAVLDLSPWSDAPWILDVLQQLVEKSLIRRVPTSEGPERFGFYSAIQAFASEALQGEGDVRRPGGEVGNRREVHRACRKRHARHYAAFGSEASLSSYKETQKGVRFQRQLSVEIENLTRAVETCIEFDEPDLAARAVTVLLTLASAQGTRLPAVEAGRRMTRVPGVEPLALARMMACLGYCLHQLGETDEALDCAHKALELASEGPPELRADLMLERAGLELLAGGWEQCAATLRQVERLCEEFNLKGIFCRLKALEAMGSGFYGEARAAQLLQEAQALAEEQNNPVALERVHGVLGSHYHLLGEPELSLQHYRKSRDLSLLAGDTRKAAIAEMHSAVVHWGTDRLEEARSALSDVCLYSVQTGDVGTGMIASINLAYTQMLLGEFDEAEQVLQRIHDLRPGHNPRSRAWVHHTLARIRLGQGRLDDAAAELEQAEEVPFDSLQKNTQVRWLLARAEVDCLLGRLAASRTALDEALRVLVDEGVLEAPLPLEAERVKGLVEARERTVLL